MTVGILPLANLSIPVPPNLSVPEFRFFELVVQFVAGALAGLISLAHLIRDLRGLTLS
jgi:hypothetical protein